jgi:hemerythrin superfamily protein
MNPIEMLESDHRKVEALFERLGKAKAPDRAKTFLEIKSALTQHAILEECIFYPAARTSDVEETQVLVSDALADHEDVKSLLAQIEVMPPESEAFSLACRRLEAVVSAHVAEEEKDLFPQARKQLGADRLGALARRMAGAKAPQGSPKPAPGKRR